MICRVSTHTSAYPLLLWMAILMSSVSFHMTDIPRFRSLSITIIYKDMLFCPLIILCVIVFIGVVLVSVDGARVMFLCHPSPRRILLPPQGIRPGRCDT